MQCCFISEIESLELRATVLFFSGNCVISLVYKDLKALIEAFPAITRSTSFLEYDVSLKTIPLLVVVFSEKLNKCSIFTIKYFGII